MRSLASLVLLVASSALAPPTGFTALLDFASGTSATTSIVRLDAGGWTHLGDVPQRFNVSTVTDRVFVGSSHGSQPATEFWNFTMAATPLLIRREAEEYDALAPFSSQEVVAYHRTKGLRLLTPQGTFDLASSQTFRQPLYDVSLARVGTDMVVLFGTPDASLALPGTVLEYHLVLVQLLGGGHAMSIRELAFPDVLSGRSPLLGSDGAIFVEADKSTGGQRLRHVGVFHGSTPLPMVSAVRTANANDRLVPLAIEGKGGGAARSLYFRDRKALSRLFLSVGSQPAVEDAAFFEPTSIGNVGAKGLSGFASSYVGIATYVPPARFQPWPTWGAWTASVTTPATLLSMGSSVTPATAFSSFVSAKMGGLANIPPATTMSSPMFPPITSSTVAPGPSLTERLETLWKTAFDKKILRTEKPSARFGAGDLVQILEQMQVDSEWLDTALRQVGRTKYEPLGLVYRSGWSAPSYGKEIVFAELVTLLGEAKSCGGLLDEK